MIDLPQQILMVEGARFMYFDWQDSGYGRGPAMWFSVPDEDTPTTEIRTFKLLYTGMKFEPVNHFFPTPQGDIYLGTALAPWGIVVHLFEIRK
jgi:hypothetical protein